MAEVLELFFWRTAVFKCICVFFCILLLEQPILHLLWGLDDTFFGYNFPKPEPIVVVVVYYATEVAHIIHYTNIQHKTQKIKTSKTIHNTETKFRYQQSEQIHSTLPSWWCVLKQMGTQLPLKRGTHPQFSAPIRCGQTAGWLKMLLGIVRRYGPWPRRHCVRWRPSSPPQNGDSSPQFSVHVGLLWPNGWMDQHATWYGGRPRPRRHCVRWGPSSPPAKGHSPQFSAHIYCGQTVGWIKMPFGTEVNVGQATLR